MTALPAGRELDALIAEKAMGFVWDDGRCRVCGWQLEPDGDGCWKDNCSMRPLPEPRADEPRPYSTDIAAAWEVLAHLQRNGAHHQVRLTGYNADEWFCDIGLGFLSGPSVTGEGHTPAEAICRAALKVVGK